MWKIEETPIPDAKLLTLPQFFDDRGLFVKTFHDTMLQDAGISIKLKESYFSISRKDVIRGMHFQTPPHQHAKIVFCPQGAILDVMVDMRKASPTYGQYFAQELSAENGRAFYIPEGFAHGFKALTDNAMTYYLVSSEYSQPNDTGIRWDSFGMDWEILKPIISARDMSFSLFSDYNTPF